MILGASQHKPFFAPITFSRAKPPLPSMEEAEELREQPHEGQLLREAAEGRALEEQHQREDAQEIERLRE